MDKINDKKKFQCPECGECFSTKQNLKRHITRKHKEVVFETVVEGPVMTVNELIETDPLISIILDDRGVVSEPQPEPIPGDEYLITLIRECEKYQHLFPAIKRQMKWNKNNIGLDMDYYKQRHILKMRFILYKISLLKCNSPIN
jgi:hypothetical protein